MSLKTESIFTPSFQTEDSTSMNANPEPDKNQERKRFCLLNQADKSVSLSTEVKDLMRQIGEKAASEKNNSILAQLFYRNYDNNSPELLDALEQAGLADLANQIRQKTFGDLPINSPRRGERSINYS